ncbi:hypothetical protein D3C84_397850 [compost metagenome]
MTLEAAQDQYSRSDTRLIQFDPLETASQCGVFLEVFFVLRPGSGGDSAQFATRQGWFEQVGCIGTTRRTTCTNQHVCFVDEQNHRCGGSFDFFDDTAQAVFELALDACTRFKCPQIKTEQARILQEVRHFILTDQQRQTFHHSRLAHARLTYHDGVVFTTSGQNIDHLADFIVAAENRVDAPRHCLGSKVCAKTGDIVFSGGSGTARTDE